MRSPTDVRDDEVPLPGGPRLALRRAAGSGAGARRPFLLVHGLASNARLWDGVTRRLALAGREVAAVDLRGHGRSERTPDGYTTDVAAEDVAALAHALGWTGARTPVVAGQSWGGNVVLTLAARRPGTAAAVACVDGGWLRLRPRFATFEECWQALAPPRLDGRRWHDVRAAMLTRHPDWPTEAVAGMLAGFVELPDGSVRARLDRAHHREILHSLWVGDPRTLYPHVDVPVLLMPAVGPGRGGPGDPTSAAVEEAAAALPDAAVSWYVGAHHDLHAQHPQRCADDLLALAARTEVTGR